MPLRASSNGTKISECVPRLHTAHSSCLASVCSRLSCAAVVLVMVVRQACAVQVMCMLRCVRHVSQPVASTASWQLGSSKPYGADYAAVPLTPFLVGLCAY